MPAILRSSWPLFVGLLLLMIGNGGQGAVLGVRAVIEEFSNETYGFVSAGYFAGFLLGSTLTPNLIRKVGHVRVFAALGSLISAALIVFVWLIDPAVWFVMRFVVGFGFSGVYIVCESWLNEASSNENRGQALGLYMFIQMIGVVAGQQLLLVGDPAGFELFIIMSVLVSISFAPILLTVTPTPISDTARPMSLSELWDASPLGCFGALTLGGVYGAMFGMASIYGARIELTFAEIAIFASMLYVGAVVMQPFIGWISDRMDRRSLLVAVALSGATFSLLGAMFSHLSLGAVGEFELRALYLISFLAGGFINPIYPLLAAHTNDHIERDQMAAASSGLVFLNGVGALAGPIVVGFGMTYVGPQSFWFFMAALLATMALFGMYRATQRGAVQETIPFAPVTPRVTAVATEIMTEVAIEQAEALEEEAEQTQDDNGPAADGKA
ncbi:MAG: MFS transporter [Neomegalonema sp.]|nr:MFS transporter [Neomegalonema sp.]